MNLELLKSYKNTTYIIHKPPISIRIDKINNDLDSLFEKEKNLEWAFITPYNPFSKILSDEENEKRFTSFENELKDYKCYEGEGVGEDPSWKPEKSLLILGIPKSKAIEIGNIYEQNAIVYGIKNEKAQLILLQD